MKKIFNFKSIFIPFVLLIVFGYSHILAQDKKQTIDNLMQMYYDYGQFNGSVLVSEEGDIILKKGYGLANMEWNIPNKPDTKFRIGSLTKQFTSMLIMQLVEAGKIKLDNKITEYLPEYRTDSGDKISVHHLLTHTSGIPSYTSLPNFFSEISRDPYSVDDFIKQFCSGDLEFEPGDKYKYSNSGYFLLGAIIEKVTGDSYENILHKRILEPLGMQSSGYDHHKTIITNRATGYGKSLNDYYNSPYLDMALPFSAGAMYSTVEDMFLWDKALYTEKLLSKKFKEIMFTPYLHNYAYGWGVFKIGLAESTDSVMVYAHSGGINGFTSRIYRIVDDHHLIVLLDNTVSGKLRDICVAITNILYDKAYNLPKKSLASILGKTIFTSGIDNAISQYYSLKENDEYNINERELNNLGYELLNNNKVIEAINIFKLNTEEYPDSDNAYDSLGEAYMINGDKELAIKNYTKSLELNPKNTNAIEMLLKLNKSNKDFLK